MTGPSPISPAAVAQDARRRLARLSRPAGAFDASRYFRGTVDLGFHNVGTAKVRALAREIVGHHRDRWSVDDAIAFANALIRDRHLESKGLGVEVAGRFRRALESRHLPIFKRWLAANHSANWATTDAICGTLIGPLLLAHPALVREVASWSRHRNMWVRRASAVGLIPSARKGLALPVAYAVARRLHADREDLIQKAVGWLLREAGKADAERLERYLRANGPSIPRTSVRYAIERFPVEMRRELLVATKGETGGKGGKGMHGR
jgi:3-methyladenine DNA glycosylase AlkD